MGSGGLAPCDWNDGILGSRRRRSNFGSSGGLAPCNDDDDMSSGGLVPCGDLDETDFDEVWEQLNNVRNQHVSIWLARTGAKLTPKQAEAAARYNSQNLKLLPGILHPYAQKEKIEEYFSIVKSTGHELLPGTIKDDSLFEKLKADEAVRLDILAETIFQGANYARITNEGVETYVITDIKDIPEIRMAVLNLPSMGLLETGERIPYDQFTLNVIYDEKALKDHGRNDIDDYTYGILVPMTTKDSRVPKELKGKFGHILMTQQRLFSSAHIPETHIGYYNIHNTFRDLDIGLRRALTDIDYFSSFDKWLIP